MAMRVLITGGAGFIGKKLARRLLDQRTLCSSPLDHLTLADVTTADGFASSPEVTVEALDIGDPGAVDRLVGRGFDAIFHLAAVVSSAAEADLELGLKVNLDGTRNLLEAARRSAEGCRFVFASSCAVYGGDLPPVVTDETALTPQTSYGSQKAAAELLVSDLGRRGIIDGRSLRLPTIVVRPGRPNKAASTFLSSIVREPLNGEEAVLPVAMETAMYVLSPRRVVDAFVRAAELPAETFGTSRSLLLPGITVSVIEMLEALERIAGPAARARVKHRPEPAIEAIVRTWPPHFRAERAAAMGFEADTDIDTIIRQHVRDELDGRLPDA